MQGTLSVLVPVMFMPLDLVPHSTDVWLAFQETRLTWTASGEFSVPPSALTAGPAELEIERWIAELTLCMLQWRRGCVFFADSGWRKRYYCSCILFSKKIAEKRVFSHCSSQCQLHNPSLDLNLRTPQATVAVPDYAKEFHSMLSLWGKMWCSVLSSSALVQPDFRLHIFSASFGGMEGKSVCLFFCDKERHVEAVSSINETNYYLENSTFTFFGFVAKDRAVVFEATKYCVARSCQKCSRNKGGTRSNVQ